MTIAEREEPKESNIFFKQLIHKPFNVNGQVSKKNSAYDIESIIKKNVSVKSLNSNFYKYWLNDMGNMCTMFCDILESDSASDSDKSFYLKLLVHFVGDLHQPLHIGRYEDRGANRVYVKWFGRNSNLHRVWDSDMINGYNMSYSELAVNLPNPDFLVFTKEAEDFKRDDILDWVNEIHSYTNQIYSEVSVDDKLGYEYQYKNFGTVKELLLIGGIRLAKILNYLFD